MKLGAENPKKVIITVALMVCALALFGVTVFSRDGGSGTAPQPKAADRQQAVKKTPASQGFDPSLRTGLLQANEDVVYTGMGRNLFTARTDPPRPPKLTCASPGGPSYGLPWCKEMIVPNRVQTDIPLKFFGFASKSGEAKKVFLSHDQDIFIAKEGDIIDRRYKIVHINPTSVDINDVLDDHTQRIGLTT